MRWWIRLFQPFAFAVGGATFALLGSLLIPDRYTSRAVIRLNVEPFPTVDVIDRAYQQAVDRRSVKSMIERLNLYPEERDRLPLEDMIEAMKKDDVKVEILPDRDVRVSFAYRDRGLAQAGANALITAMVAEADEHSGRVPGWGRLDVEQAAGPGEAGPTFAFWRQARYVAHGTLAVRKLDTFVIDHKAMEQRTEKLRQRALSPELLANLISYSHDLYGSGQNLDFSTVFVKLRRDLRVTQSRHGNVLIIEFTYTDARTAQKTVSGVVTRLIDENAIEPACGDDPVRVSAPLDRSLIPLASVNASAAPKTNNILAPFEPGSLQPDLAISAAVNTRDHEESVIPAAVRVDCHDPKTPKWERTIDLLDPASLPEEPDGPSRPIISIFGFFLGLGLWTVVKD
jgi:hypothetical protein